MTKMATLPINGNSLQKSSSLEQVGWYTWVHEPKGMSEVKVKVIQWSWLKVCQIEWYFFSLEKAGPIGNLFFMLGLH